MSRYKILKSFFQDKKAENSICDLECATPQKSDMKVSSQGQKYKTLSTYSLMELAKKTNNNQLKGMIDELIAREAYSECIDVALENKYVDTKFLQNVLIQNASPDLCYKFASNIKSADVNKILLGIEKKLDVDSICRFQGLKNVDMVFLQKAIMKTNDIASIYSFCYDFRYLNKMDKNLTRDFFIDLEDSHYTRIVASRAKNLKKFQDRCIEKNKLKSFVYSLNRNEGYSAEFCQNLVMNARNYGACGLLVGSDFDVDRNAIAEFVCDTYDVGSYNEFLQGLSGIHYLYLNDFNVYKILDAVLENNNPMDIYELAKNLPFVDKVYAGKKIIEINNPEYICKYALDVEDSNLDAYIDALINLKAYKYLALILNNYTKQFFLKRYSQNGQIECKFINHRICDTNKIINAIIDSGDMEVALSCIDKFDFDSQSKICKMIVDSKDIDKAFEFTEKLGWCQDIQDLIFDECDAKSLLKWYHLIDKKIYYNEKYGNKKSLNIGRLVFDEKQIVDMRDIKNLAYKKVVNKSITTCDAQCCCELLLRLHQDMPFDSAPIYKIIKSKLVDALIRSGSSEFAYKYVEKSNDVEVAPLIELIINNAEPEWCFKLAQRAINVDKKCLENIVVESKNIEYIKKFAELPFANKEKLMAICKDLSNEIKNEDMISL